MCSLPGHTQLATEQGQHPARLGGAGHRLGLQAALLALLLRVEVVVVAVAAAEDELDALLLGLVEVVAVDEGATTAGDSRHVALVQVGV